MTEVLDRQPKIILVGERLQHRAFNGSNQALPWLASALHNNGFDNVVQFDMENRNNTFTKLLHEVEDADLITFSGTFSVSLGQIDQDAAVLKNHLRRIRRGEVPIIVGGYGASGVDRYAQHAPFIDAFSFGPGIEQVPQIVRSVRERRFYQDLRESKIPGLSYYDHDLGKYVRATPIPMPSSEVLSSIDQLYERDYMPEIHDMEIFSGEDGKPLSTFQLVTEMGCPFECTFCSESGGEQEQMLMGRRVTAEMSLGAVEEHFIKARELGHTSAYLDIETAFRDWKRMEAILELANSYGISIGLNTRIDTARKDRIVRAADLGVDYMFFGVEHTNPQALMAVDKFTEANLLARAQKAIGYSRNVDDAFMWQNEKKIQSSLFLIMGLPKIDDVSWQKVLSGKLTRSSDLVYVQTSYEDDVIAIEGTMSRCQPFHFNTNILRLNPDTKMAWQSRYACIRPSGAEDLDAVYYVPRVAQLLGIGLQDFHPIYRFYEGVEDQQPYSTAMDPQRAHDTACIILREANKYGVHVYFDYELEKSGLITGNPKEGVDYKIASLKDFEGLK